MPQGFLSRTILKQTSAVSPTQLGQFVSVLLCPWTALSGTSHLDAGKKELRPH